MQVRNSPSHLQRQRATSLSPAMQAAPHNDMAGLHFSSQLSSTNCWSACLALAPLSIVMTIRTTRKAAKSTTGWLSRLSPPSPDMVSLLGYAKLAVRRYYFSRGVMIYDDVYIERCMEIQKDEQKHSMHEGWSWPLVICFMHVGKKSTPNFVGDESWFEVTFLKLRT